MPLWRVAYDFFFKFGINYNENMYEAEDRVKSKEYLEILKGLNKGNERIL